MIDEVEHGAAWGDHVTFLGHNVIRDGKEHLRQLRRASSDLRPLRIAILVFLHQVATVHYAQFVRVCSVRKRMQFNVLV